MGKILFRLNAGKTVMLITTVVVSIMILYPMAILIYNSFTIAEWGKPVIYTFKNYLRIFETSRYVLALKNSLMISLGTTAFAGILGLILAWITARTNTPWRGKLEPLNLIPYFLSPFVGAICWIYILSPKIGFLNVFLMEVFGLSSPPFNIYSKTGIIWVLGIFWAPYVYLFMVGLFQKMDPALEEAARTCGADMLKTLRTVTLPLVLPGILFGLVIIFVISIGAFAVPASLGLPVGINVLGTEIWELVSRYPGDYNMASAISMFSFAICIVLIVIQRKMILPREFITVTGKGYRPSLIDLGKWRYATLAFNLLYLFIGVLVPLVILIIVAVHKIWKGKIELTNLTLNNFSFILTQYEAAKSAVWNSLTLGLIGATIGMAICVILGFILVRTKMRGRGILDFVCSLPVGIPGIVMAMGILLAYIKTPIYGTLWVMGLAYITVFLPIGLRNTNAIFLAISPELEECSRTCGASWLATLKNISIPLMKSGLIGGWLILFLIFIKEINASILLFSSGNEVMSIVLFQLLEEYDASVVAAYATILTGILLVAVWLIRKIVGLDKMA